MIVPSIPTVHTPVLAYDATGSVLPPLPSTPTHAPTYNVVITTSEESGSALQPDVVQPGVIDSPEVSNSGSPSLTKADIDKQKQKGMIDWCQLQKIDSVILTADSSDIKSIGGQRYENFTVVSRAAFCPVNTIVQ